MNSNGKAEVDVEKQTTVESDKQTIAKEQREVENELKFAESKVGGNEGSCESKSESKSECKSECKSESNGKCSGGSKSECEQGNAEQTLEGDMSETAKKLADAEAKIAETNDKYVRLAAEFDNYRRRVAKEKLELISTASEDVIKGILPVLDDCYRALKVLRESDAPVSAIEGTELILNKLTAFLKIKGLAMIEAKGKEFNTDDMEAVTQFPVEDKAQKGKVIDVVQDGYTLNGKVIRFAKVVVGA